MLDTHISLTINHFKVIVVSYNEVCITIYQGLENVKTFYQDLKDQEQDHLSCP